ncbi:helix-turn-helix domain-containing protein [Flavobacterium sp.]|uniref:helix-turn-helix domain-containing protein n=1 Tax=Flavobacterium sp. TaxID=239 RepID=UPI003B9B44CA
MQRDNLGEFIRQLREQAEMPLRKLAALLDIDQSTLSKLERGERPVNRQILPMIAKTFELDEKELVVTFMSKQVAYQLADEKYAKDILIAAEEELSYSKAQTQIESEKTEKHSKNKIKKNRK